VESFGDPTAQLLIVASRRACRAQYAPGRPFTGDYAGDLLYGTLLEYGFAKGVYHGAAGRRPAVVDCRISNAVRCVPPQNKPLPVEIHTCRPIPHCGHRRHARLARIVAPAGLPTNRR